MSKIKEKTKNSIFKMVFSRIGVIVFLILLQCIYLFSAFTYLNDYLHIFLGGSYLVSFFMLLYLINNKQNPSVKIIWIIIILVVPLLGNALYWYINYNNGMRAFKRKFFKLQKENRNILKQDNEVIDNIRRDNLKELENIARYIKNESGNNIYQNTAVKYYPSGEIMFEDMLEELKKAEEYIFLEYFIIEEGKMWNSILDILVEKVKQGIEVRVMYDGLCAFTTLEYSYPKKLEKLGIKAKMFAPIRPFLSTHYNNRDHRKILVIDGKTAFTGGVNLADEYINEYPKYGTYWKDTAISLKGSAVSELTLLFLEMWEMAEKKDIDNSKYLIKIHDIKEKGYVIPYGDSPLDNSLLGENIYIDILNNAKDYVWIMTPYFVTDNEFLNTLEFVARKGVDIRLIMPHYPDKEMPFSIAHSNYRRIINAGVKVYEFSPGFMHAKMFISDDIKAVVGTINLDYRSLYHHFECAVYMYGVNGIKDIKRDFEETLEKSQLISLEDLKKDKIKRKIMGAILKVFAPLI